MTLSTNFFVENKTFREPDVSGIQSSDLGVAEGRKSGRTIIPEDGNISHIRNTLLGKTKDRLQSKRYKRCLLTDR
jgi:hypothetical protein